MIETEAVDYRDTATPGGRGGAQLLLIEVSQLWIFHRLAGPTGQINESIRTGAGRAGGVATVAGHLNG